MPPTHVHFTGSVNLADTESVMREIARRVPSGLRRIPDGETGDRYNWIFFQLDRFLESPFLAPERPVDTAADGYVQIPQVRLADGVDPGEMRWPDLGYARAYLESYATFTALRGHGAIPDDARFQVQYPTPLASIGIFVVPGQQQMLLGSYERAVFADLERLLAAIPHSETAVQWDVAVEFAVLEESFLHLCYGDYGHRHFSQPESLALQIRVLNAVIAAAGRAAPGGSRGWGICTECGMGRVRREETARLLDLHREILANSSP